MKSMLIFYFIFVAFLPFTRVKSTIVNSCTSVNASLPVVEIKNCDQSPCIFYIGSAGVMTMKFRAPRYLEHIRPNAFANALGLDVTYPLGQDDACDGVINTPCPLAKNEYIEYTYSMDISSYFPAVGLTLEFSLLDLDRDNEAFVCFRVQLQLKNS